MNKLSQPHKKTSLSLTKTRDTLSSRGKRNIVILSIETSCDETAASVLKVENKKSTSDWPRIQTLSSVVKSQIKLHSKMGGVVPETAARAHVKYIKPVVEKALAASRHSLNTIDYIAVTKGPGLAPSLIVGVEFAKALSLASGVPLLPMNHMAGHLYSPLHQIETLKLYSKDVFPHIAMIVSGGHTMLVLLKSAKHYQVLGKTVDDAAGEAFDKVAKLLTLPYPGGPEVSKLAKLGNPSFAFPRPMMHTKDFNFSFAGLKTAVLYRLRDFPDTKPEDICKAFEDAVVEVLLYKTKAAAQKYKAKSISLSGGVSANQKLRADLQTLCDKLGTHCFVPPFRLSTDNAEMIGIAAAFGLWHGLKPTPLGKIQANPNLQL